jgi:hypothetical protein
MKSDFMFVLRSLLHQYDYFFGITLEQTDRITKTISPLPFLQFVQRMRMPNNINKEVYSYNFIGYIFFGSSYCTVLTLQICGTLLPEKYLSFSQCEF